MKIKFLALLIITLASCKPNPSKLTIADFNDKSGATGSVILDVRSPEEYNEGFIKGAVNIDFEGSDFETKIAALDKSNTYYLYCRSGARSSKTLNKMSASGFKDVYILDGGVEAWKNEKMPLETPSENSLAIQATDLTKKDPEDFKTAIYGDKLVFVDFNAEWCGPCKKMQPFVDMIKEERSREVIVFSIDTDKEQVLAKEYQIFNLPTVVFIKKGTVLYRAEGYHDQESLNALVTKYK